MAVIEDTARDWSSSSDTDSDTEVVMKSLLSILT